MAIDSYSLCPGGRGKKIRFCCPDHLKDLEKIDQFIEGEQYAAGLSFVESLEKQRPNCACLTEAKCLFQRMIGLWEEAYATAKSFATREPKNVVAQTELATTAALLDKPQEAVVALVDGLECVEGEQFPLALVQAMLTVGSAFYEQGRLFQAVAIAKQLQAFAPQDRASNAFLYRCLGSETVPLMLKEQTFDLTAPESFPKKKEYDSAIALLARGEWKRGRTILESLIVFGEQWPNLFRNLGIVELWFVNEDKGRAYLERYLASPDIDFESAVDVEQFLFLLASPTWDDVEYMVKRVYELDDFDFAFEKFLSAKRLIANPRLQNLGISDVPPKMAFSVLDRPLSDETDNISLDSVSTQCGTMFLYGKQTTRPARAEFYIFPSQVEFVETLLASELGVVPKMASEENLEQQPIPWTTNASTPRFQFKDPSKLSTETLEKLFDLAFERFAKEWYEHSYHSLQGQSPKETAVKPDGKRKVEAMIRLVSSLFTPPYFDKIAALLRAQAGLDSPEPIAPPTNFASVEDALEFFRQVPIWRWNRLLVEQCQTDVLAEMLQIANLVAPRDVKEKFAAEFLKRPVEETKYEDRSAAYSVMIDAKLLSQDYDGALGLIAEAGKYANSIGQSDSQWNVLEIMTRFRLQDFDAVRSLARHVFAEHQNDKDAIQTLQQFFAELNASAQAQMQAAEAYRLRAAQQNGGASAPASPLQGVASTNLSSKNSANDKSENQSSGLWTPGSDTNSASNSNSSKLWIPD